MTWLPYRARVLRLSSVKLPGTTHLIWLPRHCSWCQLSWQAVLKSHLNVFLRCAHFGAYRIPLAKQCHVTSWLLHQRGTGTQSDIIHIYHLKRLCPLPSQTPVTKLQAVVGMEYLQVVFQARSWWRGSSCKERRWHRLFILQLVVWMDELVKTLNGKGTILPRLYEVACRGQSGPLGGCSWNEQRRIDFSLVFNPLQFL